MSCDKRKPNRTIHLLLKSNFKPLALFVSCFIALKIGTFLQCLPASVVGGGGGGVVVGGSVVGGGGTGPSSHRSTCFTTLLHREPTHFP